MIPAIPPDNEKQRLAALDSYRVLDTEPEMGFDDLTAVAAATCNTPIALVSLIDAKRQWFKSHCGLAVAETPREYAFCTHAILGSETFVVPDATLDPRFQDNPLTIGEPHVRFYAGVPLINPEGFALGTLCVIDHVPRELTSLQLNILLRLGRQVVSQLELRRARDLAESAVAAKTRFLASMSHEVRTPLNGLLGVTQLLAESSLNSGQRELVQIAQRSGEHLLSVVNDILEFSRLDAGGLKLELASFNLKEAVNDVLAITTANAKRKGIQLQLEWQSLASPHRQGDVQRVRQVLFNLVANAIKFTAQGSVTLRVSDDMAAPAIKLAVIDTGIGIAPDVIPKLFNRFTQADSSTTRQFGGTGLGLAITRRLVELMGGQVGVDSELGKGSCFWCSIPLPIIAGELDAPTASKVNEKPVYCDLHGRSVLVAEDDAVNLMILMRQLQRHNCVVTDVGTGSAAVELCKQRPFDLILMDGMMPEMDGYEATRQIRALPQAWASRVPIIALTASAMDGDREECFLAGMTDYVSKPINLQAFNAALQRAISVRTLTAEQQPALQESR
jgi:signal transduction histidine kinase/AmiR/NasT family two-component response regulator